MAVDGRAGREGEGRLRLATRRNVRRAVVGVVVIAVLVWSALGCEVDLPMLAHGIQTAAGFLRQSFPPDWHELPTAIANLIVTVQMAFVATVCAFVAALPVSFVAARTEAVPRPISVAVKQCLNVMRAIPPIIYALLFVYMVGLGPFPGALGIAVGSFVMLAKLFAETLESVHPAPVEAVKAVGGNTAQVFAYGMLPQALPQFLSHTMYAWELNISAATIMGVVGAGGIGQQLMAEIHYYAWPQVSTYVLVLVLMVLLADALSYQVRKRVT